MGNGIVQGLFLLAALWWGAPVGAQSPGNAAASFPNRPVRIIVPQPPGSAPDASARRVAQRLAEEWKQSVVVDNRPGASGAIAMEAAAKAPPDGYTVVLANSITLGTLPHLAKVPYDPFRDFVAVTKLSASPFVLVSYPGVPAASLPELIAHARANPDKLNLASPGAGSTQHLILTMLDKRWGTRIAHVPYKGGSQTTADLIAGQVQLMLDFPAIVFPHVRAGRLRALAITSDRRSPALPEVPTFEEMGHAGLQLTAWQGVLAPAGTPREIIARLNEAFVRALNSPDVRDAFIQGGAEIGGDSPEQFAAFIRSEHARWGSMVRDSGLRLD